MGIHAADADHGGGRAHVDGLAISLQGFRSLVIEFVGAPELEPDAPGRAVRAGRCLAGFDRGADVWSRDVIIAGDAGGLVGIVGICGEVVAGFDVGFGTRCHRRQQRRSRKQNTGIFEHGGHPKTLGRGRHDKGSRAGK